MPELIEQIRGTASLLVPEIILLATVCMLFLTGPFLVSDTGEAPAGLRHRWGFVSLVALVIAWLVWYQGGDERAAGGLFRIDHLVWYTRGVALSAGVLLALATWNQVDDSHSAEVYACLLSIIVGTTLVAAANDLVPMFLALELVSIPTYVILYLPRRDRLGGEATLKYFLLSVFSSALVLYGMSWLYGVAGSTNFTAIADVLSNRQPHAGEGLLQISFALLIAGLSFRIAAVPFHFYAPDVFQGTTAANAGLLSFVPKVVGFVAMLRLVQLSGATESWTRWEPDHSAKLLLAVLAAATMIVGNLMALRQKNVYRLMAYSSVAQAGYMLIGLTVGDVLPVGGRQALLFYLAAYGLMTIGFFALLASLSGDPNRRGSWLPAPCATFDELRGLSRRQPSVAFLLAVCLFSLTGLPPTAGFFGKLNLFLAAWSDDTRIGPALAILLAINAAIAAFYYLRLVALMYLEPVTMSESGAEPEVMHSAWGPWLAGAFCAVATIAIFIWPQWLWDSIR